MRQSIQDIAGKFKGFLANDTLFMALLLILVGVGSFGLGRGSVPSEMLQERELSAVAVSAAPPTPKPPVSAPGRVSTGTADLPPSQPETEIASEQSYIGSKNGTKFHLLTCPGASQIKEENKVYFSSKQEAYSKGYTEAANCKGI